MNSQFILLVEDNEDDVRLARRALRKNNIQNELVVASDGLAALDYLCTEVAPGGTSRKSLPAVVLLDLKLPKMDGMEVLRRIRSDPSLRRQPVVILTTSTEDKDISRSYELGANSYIRKPVDFVQFCEAFRQLAVYWLTLNQPPP